jgi:EmrB/QacA subfamily drug resistance transporter
MTQDALASAPRARQRPARWVSGRRARVLLCASGVSFIIMLDSNIVAVSLPSIARDLNATFADIEWVVSAYVLTFAALLMPSGALADRYGRRRMLIVGLAVFVLASLICGLAPSALVLNAARALQGVGAAIELSAALAVLGHAFQGAERAKAFGFWGTVVGVAVALGPLVGGLITSTLGWRWAFLVNVPVGSALTWLAIDAVEESRDPNAQRLDFVGMLSFGGGLFCLIWALIGANRVGWSAEQTLAKLLASAVLFALFVAAELIQQRPMVDFALFRKRTFLGACFAMLGFAASAQVMMTYLPLYLQNVFALSPAIAGLGMLPFALPLFFCPRIAASLSNRISGRDLLALGLAIVAAGNLATAAMVANHLPLWVRCDWHADYRLRRRVAQRRDRKSVNERDPAGAWRHGLRHWRHVAFRWPSDRDHRTWRRVGFSNRKAFRSRGLRPAFIGIVKRRPSDRRQDRRWRHRGRRRINSRTSSSGDCRAGARKFRLRVHNGVARRRRDGGACRDADLLHCQSRRNSAGPNTSRP